MITPLLCPFCDQPPVVSPLDPKLDGDAWGRVACMNHDCVMQPSTEVFDDVDPIAKAVRQWNSQIKKAYKTAFKSSVAPFGSPKASLNYRFCVFINSRRGSR